LADLPLTTLHPSGPPITDLHYHSTTNHDLVSTLAKLKSLWIATVKAKQRLLEAYDIFSKSTFDEYYSLKQKLDGLSRRLHTFADTSTTGDIFQLDDEDQHHNSNV